MEDLERNQIPAPPKPLRFVGIPEHTATSLGVPAVIARDLTVPDRLAPLNLKVQPGEQLLVEGPNGSGKSTLLKIIDGELTDYSGEIIMPEEMTVARLEQDDSWTDLSVTGAELVAGIVDMGLMTPEQAAKPLADLSLGQRRRVSLGMILSSPPDLLLLDEPTNHLSLALAEELEAALVDFPGTVIMTSHDRWIRRRWRQRIAQKDGRATLLTLSTLWTGEVWREED